MARKEYGGILGVELILDSDKAGGFVASAGDMVIGPEWFMTRALPRTTFAWRPGSAGLNEKLLPEQIRVVYKDVRRSSAVISFSLPWYILRYPHILHYMNPISDWTSYMALALGKCRFEVLSQKVGVARWERYYEGNRTNDGFILDTSESRLWIYVDEERISAYYFSFVDANSVAADYLPGSSQIALYVTDGKCTVIAEDGHIVEGVFDELQNSLPAYWELCKLRGMNGTELDDIAWSRLERGLKAVKTKPTRTHVCDNLYSMRILLENGPYKERNIMLMIENWEFPYSEYERRSGVVRQKLTKHKLQADAVYKLGDLRVENSEYWEDKSLITIGKNDYDAVLGNPSYIIKVDEYGHPWYASGALSRTWFVNLEQAYPVLPVLPKEDEEEYSEMKQLADRLGDSEKSLGEFGANPMVKRFISDLQNRRVSFRKAESGTTFDWNGTAYGDSVLWELRWDTCASPRTLHISLGPKDFQVERGSARISPSPEGYVLYHNGPLKPFTSEDEASLLALVRTEQLGVVVIPEEVKGGWEKFVQFIDGGMQTTGTKLENVYEHQSEEQEMELLN